MAGSVFCQGGGGLMSPHRVLVELEPGPSELLAAGCVFSARESVLPNLLTWYLPGVCHVFAAYDHTKMVWLFRAKGYRTDPSPVFPSASALLVWMKVEGWLNG